MLMRTDPFRQSDVFEQGGGDLTAAMDAYRLGDVITVLFDLPGVDPDSLDLRIEHGKLVKRGPPPVAGARRSAVSGPRAPGRHDQPSDHARRCPRRGARGCEALHDGVLTLRVPFTKARSRAVSTCVTRATKSIEPSTSNRREGTGTRGRRTEGSGGLVPFLAPAARRPGRRAALHGRRRGRSARHGQPDAPTSRRGARPRADDHTEEFVSAQIERYVSGNEPFLERFAEGMVVEVRANRMPDGGFVTTFTDITASVEAAEALERSNETLERRVRERTEELTNSMPRWRAQKARPMPPTFPRPSFWRPPAMTSCNPSTQPASTSRA